MKMPKESETGNGFAKAAETRRKAYGQSSSDPWIEGRKTAGDPGLMKKLKELRLNIAQEKKVPAFVIFSDATLADICRRMPSSLEELLEVSGVGKVKLEAYGKALLEVINNSGSADVPKLIQTGYGLDEVCQLIINTMELSDDSVPVSMVVDKINIILLQCDFKTVSAQKVTEYLVQNGYLEIEEENGSRSRVASLKGMEAGITTIIKVSNNRESYKQNLYNRDAQNFLVSNIQFILKYIYKIEV